MARPSISNVSSDPGQGVVLCNTVIQAANATGPTIYCSKAMYHEGHHQSALGFSVGQPVSIYNNK